MAELEVPVISDSSQLVENVYPVAGTVTDPDVVSRDRMEELLIHRFEPDADPVRGGIAHIPVGARDVWRPKFNGMWWGGLRDGRQWATLVVGASLLLTAVANKDEYTSIAQDGADEVMQVKDRIEDGLGIGRYTDECATSVIERTTATETEVVSFALANDTDQPVAESVVDRTVAVDMFRAIEERSQKGSYLQRIEIVSGSSDDFRAAANSGIGTEQAQNLDYAQERLFDLLEVVDEVARDREVKWSVNGGDIDIQAKEFVLSDTDQLRLDNALAENGGMTLDQALALYNDPELRPMLDDSLFDTMYELIGAHRGTVIELTFTQEIVTPGSVEKHCIPADLPDGSPEDRNHDYDPVALAALWLLFPKFRKEYFKKVSYRDVKLPDGLPEPEFLRLYPEAINEDNLLVDEAWSLVRKYQYLMREDDRIQRLLKFEYTDTDGEQQVIRAAFIDHVPTTEALEMFSHEIEKLCQMQGGRVGREIDFIAVYPTDNAGLEHGNPKRVALGQDIQYESGVGGVIYPMLGLVEMHMPTDITDPEDFEGYMGPRWIFAHEAGGHGTDLNDDPNELIPLGVTNALTGAQVYAGPDRIADTAQRTYDRSEVEEEQIGRYRGRVRRAWDVLRDRVVMPTRATQWRVFRGLQDRNRDITESDTLMSTYDPRLPEAVAVRKETGRFTEYGATNAAEFWAENAASEMTGIQIPFDEAKDGAGIRPEPAFAQGYAPSTRMHQQITDRWGAVTDPRDVGEARFVDADGNPVTYRSDWRYSFGRPEDDEEFAAMMGTARQRAVPEDDEFLEVFTGRRIAEIALKS